MNTPIDRLNVLIARIEAWEEPDSDAGDEILLDIKQCMESIVRDQAAALPGRETAADLESIKSALASTSRGFQYRRTVKGEAHYRTAKDDLALLVTECESLRTALASADAAVQEPSLWQPIETAPISVPVFVHDDGAVFKAMLSDGEWLDLECGRDDAICDPPPQHWMPLPAAPRPATEPTK